MRPSALRARKCVARTHLLPAQWLAEFKDMLDRNEDGVLSLAEMTDMFHGARARAVEREMLQSIAVGDADELPALHYGGRGA